MKTCKTCGGPLLYWNPETYTYKQVINILRKLHNAGEKHLPDGIYTLEAAINCQECASKKQQVVHRICIGKIEQDTITRHLSEPLTYTQLANRLGITRRSSYRRLTTLHNKGIIKRIATRPAQYVLA